MRQKTITLRLPEEEYVAFTVVCNGKGYSKTGKIREFIREMVKREIGEVELKAGEWKKLRAGIKEIEEGRFSSLEEIKRDLARRKLADKQGRQ
jgi:siroheme synthase (precorrin-2 oxidase/ferrochelatase)